MELKVEKTKKPKQKFTDESALTFGDLFTDHMFTMKYKKEKGWHDMKIEPFSDFSLSPAAMVLHYGQEAFEGLKAYKNKDGVIKLFRPWDNMKRMNDTCKRLCLPQFDEELVLEAMYELIRLESDWIPSSPGTSLYIRPAIIATEQHLGVRPANEYLFFIILSPVGAYYAAGLKPVSIYVENEYIRSAKGGTGSVKTGGNYAASLIASDKAHSNGCEQVLWLDAGKKEFIEEVGSMNIFFMINNEIITPALEGSILPGITRDSVIKLAQDMGYKVKEQKISINDFIRQYKKGRVQEVFGTGTAAVISPVGTLIYDKTRMVINGGRMGEVSQKLYDTLTGMQYGDLPDKYNWLVQVI